MTTSDVPAIPISEIKVINPRARNKYTFDQIVASIAAVGLKTPITVSKREMSPDGTQYDLVCGRAGWRLSLHLAKTEYPQSSLPPHEKTSSS
jgi:ParB family transcriptional regulator, chromosome partitioning protein